MRVGNPKPLPSYSKSYKKKDFAQVLSSKNSSLEKHALTKYLAFELSLESKKAYSPWWSKALSTNLEENLLPALNVADISIDEMKLSDILRNIAKN